MEVAKRTRLDTAAIVVGYAMSRLDIDYFFARGLNSWEQAYIEAATSLSRPGETFKNLRDEFDPVHPNIRRGWRQRTLRPDRQRVLEELQNVSNDALLELVDRILKRDERATVEAIDALAAVNNVAANVAERLLTEGLKKATGPILFTDREWSEAKLREDNYVLIVIGNLGVQPLPRLIRNPRSVLAARCVYRQSLTAEWHIHISAE